jgi:hypothetical protein
MTPPGVQFGISTALWSLRLVQGVLPAQLFASTLSSSTKCLSGSSKVPELVEIVDVVALLYSPSGEVRKLLARFAP